MRKIESGEGATALNVDVDKIHPELTTGTSGLPPAEPMNLIPRTNLFGGDPVLARRLDDLERRVKTLEDRE